jgi:hypothetical protein
MIVKQLLSNFNQDFQAAAALEVLRGQQIKLIHAVSNSKFHKY